MHPVNNLHNDTAASSGSKPFKSKDLGRNLRLKSPAQKRYEYAYADLDAAKGAAWGDDFALPATYVLAVKSAL
jgi:hypothetical protein